MSGRRFGGPHSPGGGPAGGPAKDALAKNAPAKDASGPAPFRGRPAARISIRARLMFLLPLPLLFAGLGAIGRSSPDEMLAELGGFFGLTLSAWLLNEGLRAEAAYEARAVARPPAAPRKLLAAVLTGASVFAVGLLSLGHGLLGAAAFGLVAGLAQTAAFGLDPMRKKGIEGDDFTTERVARALDQAEDLVRATIQAAARLGDRRLEGRVDRLAAQAREVMRTIEADPRDLARSRRFIHVYLRGLRDATVKLADLMARGRDPEALTQYEALLGDLEQSFATQRVSLLEGDRSDLEVEIEVLRDRLQQDGLVAR